MDYDHDSDTITLDQLRGHTTKAPKPPLITEPTEAHDLAVQAALYSRAVGYTRSRQVLDRMGNPVSITEELPPDTTAAFLWLKNRKGWKDKQDVEHSGKVTLESIVAGNGS